MTVNWWTECVFYEIYVRSFQDSNGDGIGDLNGITQRLEYLVDLGIDVIWLTPLHPSPRVDFGHDISDYRDVDPQFGTLADFDRLVDEAHHRDIRIVTDLVLNHTSDQHEWFRDSRSDRAAKDRDWYIAAVPAQQRARRRHRQVPGALRGHAMGSHSLIRGGPALMRSRT